jgi:hypothetical protein
MNRYSTIQYNTVQYSTVQYSTVQYSTVQYSINTISMPIFLKANGFLQLNSYWFKEFRKLLVQSLKYFQKATYKKFFRKLLGLTIADFFMNFPAAFGNP